MKNHPANSFAACIEQENFINHIQEKFYKWTPPKFIKDNITKSEQNFMNNWKQVIRS